MAPYLLGFKGPAQCIEFEPKPMKVHVVPRSGAEPQVTLLRCKALCAALCALAAGEVLVRPITSAEGGLGAALLALIGTGSGGDVLFWVAAG